MRVTPTVLHVIELIIMSSTNRGTIRQVNDHYDTPTYTTRSLLDAHDIKYPVLEPCAGNLAIANMLNKGLVTTNDINPESQSTFNYDYLNYSFKDSHINTVITNPPFNIAQQIIDRALNDVVEGGEVIMLLRVNFLGSQKRKPFWKDAPLKYVYVLSKRPAFINGKTDSIEYAWFVFERGYTGNATIQVI